MRVWLCRTVDVGVWVWFFYFYFYIVIDSARCGNVVLCIRSDTFHSRRSSSSSQQQQRSHGHIMIMGTHTATFVVVSVFLLPRIEWMDGDIVVVCNMWWWCMVLFFGPTRHLTTALFSSTTTPMPWWMSVCVCDGKNVRTTTRQMKKIQSKWRNESTEHKHVIHFQIERI